MIALLYFTSLGLVQEVNQLQEILVVDYLVIMMRNIEGLQVCNEPVSIFTNAHVSVLPNYK